MSKRTPGLPQRPRGFWPTPLEATAPLIPFLPPRARYGEPCAGNGQLIRNLSKLWPGGQCVWASDLLPEGPGIDQHDARLIDAEAAEHVGLWISNPPWPMTGQKGDPAISIIRHLAGIAPTWMLLPWDFGANEYFGAVSRMCSDVVPIGRVSWLGNGTPGKDNAAWFRFDAMNRQPPAIRARAA